jgi:hypothetical protein
VAQSQILLVELKGHGLGSTGRPGGTEEVQALDRLFASCGVWKGSTS